MLRLPQFDKKWHTKVFVALITIFAATAIVYACRSFSVIGTDGVFYAEMARSIAEGEGLSVYGVPHTIYSPLLSFVIAPFYSIGIPLDVAAHIPVILFALATIFGVYFVGRKMHSHGAGLLATLFLATNGMYLWSAAVSLSPQYISSFFSLLGLLCAIVIRDVPLRKITVFGSLAGLCIGFAYLARPEYFFLIFPVVASVAFFVYRTHGWKRSLLASVSIFAAFVISISPYLLYLHQELGYWTISGRGNELALATTSGSYETVDEVSGNGVAAVVAPPTLGESALSVALGDLPGVFKRLADNLVNTEHALLRLFGTVGTFFAGFGCWALIRRRQYWELTLLASFFSPVVLVAYAQGGSPNYLVQFFFIITPLIGIGILETTREASGIFHWNARMASSARASVAIAASVYFMLPMIQNILFLPMDYRDQEYKEIGQWMNKNIPNIEFETVVSRKPEPTFYARSLWSIIPNATSTEALYATMIERGQKYVIADDRAIVAARPELAALLKPEVVAKDFSLIYQVEYHGKRAYLYQIRERE